MIPFRLNDMKASPPYTITPTILALFAEIAEFIGRYVLLAEQSLTPRLRRENRIRTIQASLAIEHNSLTLEQVSAVIEGKRVLGHPREIQEVLNAFSAYEAMEGWNPCSERDLLLAHETLMRGLVEDAGMYRHGGVGVFRGQRLVHMAPPAHIVQKNMVDLLNWLKNTREHPLVASCIFHYEFEFIHPFSDGNGRMGRLWQTLILRNWRSLLAYLPVETVIHQRQEDYYIALSKADKQAEATPFIEFMLQALLDSVREILVTDQVSDQVSDQVAALIGKIGHQEFGANELMQALGLSHRPTFRNNYLNPALKDGWIERTSPKSPRSPTQKYRLSARGRRWFSEKR